MIGQGELWTPHTAREHKRKLYVPPLGDIINRTTHDTRPLSSGHLCGPYWQDYCIFVVLIGRTTVSLWSLLAGLLYLCGPYWQDYCIFVVLIGRTTVSLWSLLAGLLYLCGPYWQDYCIFVVLIGRTTVSLWSLLAGLL